MADSRRNPLQATDESCAYLDDQPDLGSRISAFSALLPSVRN